MRSAAQMEAKGGRLWRAGQALRLAWQSEPRAAAMLVVLTALGALMPLGVAYLGKASVDAVSARSGARALWLVAAECVLVIALSVVQRLSGLWRSLLGTRLALSVNLQILGKALTLELRHFQDPDFYDQLTRARREASARPLAMATELMLIAQCVLMLLGFVGLLVSFSGLAVLVLMLAALPAAAVEVRLSQAAFAQRNLRAAEARQLSYLEYVLASDEHAKEVMTLELGPVLLERYRSLGASLAGEEQGLLVRRTLWGTLLSQLGTLSFYGCYLMIAGLAAAGRITIGELTLYVVAFRQGQQAFQGALMSLGSLYEHDLYLSNLLDFLAIPTGRTLPAAGATPPLQGERGIRFVGVGFRYPGQEQFALRNIDLFIPAGRSLALVGHNGAGKSTFIKLLTGLYEPTEGQILLDGCDLRQLPPAELRRRMAVVFQDFNQYQFSVRENVGYGSAAHLPDPERVRRAVERSGAGELVRALPEGMDTQLGRWFHKGVELSGGQWQRIALARAFMREEADILILDEPSAALDADAEQELFERFRQLSAGRTVLLISHRFPTVRQADYIVVIESSRIAEQGNHAELLAAHGRYAALFEVQASGYL